MNESQPILPRRPSPLRPVIFILVVLAAIVAVVGASKWFAPRELVPWQSDLAAAQAQAKVSNKPILAYFTAEWCGPCQEMRRTVFSDRAVADAMQRVIPVRIDVDKQAAVAHQFHIEVMPTFILLDPDGRTLRSEEGGMTADEILQWLAGKE